MMLPKTIIISATLKLQLPKTETVRHTFGLWDIKYEIAHYCKHYIEHEHYLAEYDFSTNKRRSYLAHIQMYLFISPCIFYLW